MILEIEEAKYKLTNFRADLKELGSALRIDNLKEEAAVLEEKTLQPDFWGDQENSGKILRQLKQLKDKIERYERMVSDWDDAKTLVAIAIEEDDDSLLDEISEACASIKDTLDTMTLETLLTGKYDKCNAIITFHAGAGGTEAQDWASMLMRMYEMWAAKRGYGCEVLDLLDGDEAGIKSATIQITGLNAYGYAKAEKGVHRLVRISPFDASGRRHTSFASVEVMPEIEDEIDIKINPEDLKVDTYRASGAGGQHVNKTESAIRITHIPTGVIVACQNERSQHKNRDTAMKMLKAKLVEIAEQQQKDKIEDIKGVQKEIAWGSQIRSYVFHPYNMVKDHRTNFEVGNIGAVMDGDLDGFVNAYLKSASLGTLNLK